MWFGSVTSAFSLYPLSETEINIEYSVCVCAHICVHVWCALCTYVCVCVRVYMCVALGGIPNIIVIPRYYLCTVLIPADFFLYQDIVISQYSLRFGRYFK